MTQDKEKNERIRLSMIEDILIDFANSYHDLTTSDLQGLAGAEAIRIKTILTA